MTFRNRLIIGFIGIALLVSAFSATLYTLGNSYENKLRLIVEEQYVKVRLAEQIMSNTSLVQNLINLAALNPLNSLDEQRLHQLFSANRRLFEKLNTPPLLSASADLLEGAETAYILYERKLQDAASDMVKPENQESVLVQSVYDLELLYNGFNMRLQGYADLQERLMMADSKDAIDSISKAKTLIAALWFGVILFTLLIGLGVLRGALSSIRRISKVMERFDPGRTGQLERIPIVTKDEINIIAHAYNQMADALEEHKNREKRYQEALEQENWLKTQLSEVAGLYQDNHDLVLFSNKLLSMLAPLTGAACASFYVLDDSGGMNVYVRKGSYAWDPDATGICQFYPGEGLVGQCASEGRAILTKAPADYVRVVSGVGSSPPAYLHCLPIRHNNEIIGVLELAFFKAADNAQVAFLVQICDHSLGTIIRNLQYQKHVEKLFSDSQTFNEELQVQSEELLQQQEALRILNERLEEQVKISETHSRYKSEFLANMSHELRTPLNSLLVLAQILRENKTGNLSKKQLEYADTMVISGNQLLSLINDILDLSKIEAGQMTVSEECFELPSLLNELHRQFLPLMEEKGLAYSTLAEPGLESWQLIGDRQRILQILRNLLSNALKFTKNGSVSLRAFLIDDRPMTLGFAVTDTGIGIAKELQKSIFETFKQVESNSTRKYGGTGLGLAISQELAKLLGGEVTVNSAPASGSTFLLTLPVQIADPQIAALRPAEAELAAAVEHSETADGSESLEQPPTQPAVIMLVDDDMRNIYSISSVLEDYGYTVICASNGAEVLELIETNRIDLILMDIMMPDMDGYEAMRYIRQSSHLQDIPIIALTAKAMKEDRDLCIAAGANDYISKPVRLDKLLSLIRVWLAGRQRI